MWLLNSHTFELSHTETLRKQGWDGRYAVLSHRWSDDEVTFQDMQSGIGRDKLGFKKIEGFCSTSRETSLHYVWIDTCCIDKTDSVELTRAINLMWRWYKESSNCVVYLQDVDWRHWRESTWFTRGWTLQELVAPANIQFCDKDWKTFAFKSTIVEELSEKTGIDKEVLSDPSLVSKQSIAARMSWAANRQTTRIEDRAYSLLGILGVKMSIIYGEEEAAMARLQRKLSSTMDETLFTWSGKPRHSGTIYATTPDAFSKSKHLRTIDIIEPAEQINTGILFKSDVLYPCSVDTYILPINCADGKGSNDCIGLYIRPVKHHQRQYFLRVQINGSGFASSAQVQKARQHKLRMDDNVLLLAQPVKCPAPALPDILNGFKLGRCIRRHKLYISAISPWKQTKACFIAPLLFDWSQRYLCIELANTHKGIAQILLGFDERFNPRCILMEQPTFEPAFEHFEMEWPNVPSSGVYSMRATNMLADKKSTPRLRWFLQGDSETGMSAQLWADSTTEDMILVNAGHDSAVRPHHKKSCILTFQKVEVETKKIWQFDIQDVDDPHDTASAPATKSQGESSSAASFWTW